jgi:flagella basal body P-ring formation protein FlgA
MALGGYINVASVLGSILACAASAAEVPPVTANAKTPGECLRVRVPIAANVFPDAASFESVACAATQVVPAFDHDATAQITRTARILLPGEIVPLYPEFGADIIRPGETLQLVARSGAVRIVRQVQALQSARSGERLFVKSNDGQIFSARYEAAAP